MEERVRVLGNHRHLVESPGLDCASGQGPLLVWRLADQPLGDRRSQCTLVQPRGRHNHRVLGHSGVLGFILTSAATIIHFLIMYTAGELIYPLLAIEESIRRTMHLMRENIHLGTRPPTYPASP